ncbi:MAG: hypothetical protein CME65_02830 [Halobacteriovoraceae bacterium]|nr:hypothetical protein [Halobacteriovoraceae bacterium]|tara:strand:- start:3557 stop:5218 length:1662 start_codon:yes stop_codon:yes gene_type:complete
MTKVSQMKWWGWGDENQSFDSERRPYFLQYIKETLSISNFEEVKPVEFSSIEIPASIIHDELLSKIESIFSKQRVEICDHSRILHAYGKSYRDLFRARKGEFKTLPDVIVYPKKSHEILALVDLAKSENIEIIPFGGGSNIVGSVEFLGLRERVKITVDMKLFNQLIDIDKTSMQATFGAGILGPELEKRLDFYSMTLGHFPDSFQFSTLGGWVATRSAGMQSDRYGKIEDMVIGLKIITSNGELTIRNLPRSSNGIDLKHLFIGSEGIFGIITEITVKIHPKPMEKKIIGFFFPEFSAGIEAILSARRQGLTPSFYRLSDNEKTKMSMAFKEIPGPFQTLKSQAVKKYLSQIKRFNSDELCLLLVCFEGDKKSVKEQVILAKNIFSSFNAFDVGEGASKSFEQTKYDFPYVRDYVMNYDCVADVSETVCSWSQVQSLYNKVVEEVKNLESLWERKILISCHISHTYHSGASLYFTWGAQAKKGDNLELYESLKSKTEEIFVSHGGSVSHHHGVGYEHKKWLEEEIGSQGIQILKNFKSSVDLRAIFNSGKIF